MHFDWAISRGDSTRDIEAIGREIERMDSEMERLNEEIALLDRSRFTILPLTSLKTQWRIGEIDKCGITGGGTENVNIGSER